MRVIENKQIFDDDWMLLSESATIPDTGDVIVSLERWTKEYDLLSRRQGKTGVVLRSAESPDAIVHRDELPLIAIDFPKFTDGRGYSHARLLRERYQYKGELRAVGNVLRDQLFYMLRCGIDSFALQPGKNVEGALEAFNEFDVLYQAAADLPVPLYRRVAR
jgi:uncharacterized protein (DUF934 family)